uniref:Uncharacterized protein n=1 Tax=Triticum urartu TaxID=4572 RepID=A0A8R7PJS3_TRIUA
MTSRSSNQQWRHLDGQTMRRSLDKVGNGGADDGHLHRVGALLRQPRRHGDAGAGEGVGAAAREGRGLAGLLLARRVVAPVDAVVRLGERGAHPVVQRLALLQRPARPGARRPLLLAGEHGLDVVDAVAGHEHAHVGGHLGQAPRVGVGAVVVLAQPGHAEAVVHAPVGARRRPARRLRGGASADHGGEDGSRGREGSSHGGWPHRSLLLVSFVRSTEAECGVSLVEQL